MKPRFDHSPEFARLVAGDASVNLARINLEIARDADPGLDLAACLDQIGAIAERVRPRCKPGGGPTEVIAQINWALFIEDGFRGNTDDYFDPRNSYLNEVLDRKLGIPISLSILYAEVARRLDLDLGGINMPLHFLLRATELEPATFVDPFHEGAILDRKGCEELVSRLSGQPVRLSIEQFTPSHPATVISRMLRNLKRVHLAAHQYAEALPIVRRIAALNPLDSQEQRDWGVVALRSDHPGEAVGPLARYVDEYPEAADADAIKVLLATARRDQASRN